MATHKAELIKEMFDLGRHINSKQSKSNLTMIQLRTVMFVVEQGRVKPTNIANHFAITPASVTSQIDTLVEEGWLKREPNANDKRVLEVIVTKKGKTQLPKELENLEKNYEWIFTTLNKDEQGNLLELLKKVNNSVRR